MYGGKNTKGKGHNYGKNIAGKRVGSGVKKASGGKPMSGGLTGYGSGRGANK